MGDPFIEMPSFRCRAEGREQRNPVNLCARFARGLFTLITLSPPFGGAP